MDGHDPHRVHVGRGADLRIGCFPGLEEFVEGVAVHVDEVQYIVHEGLDVESLVGKTLFRFGEESEQAFTQVCQGVIGGLPYVQPFPGSQVGTDRIFRVPYRREQGDQLPYDRGCLDPQGIVGYHVITLFHEEGSHFGACIVVPHEDGDVSRKGSCREYFFHGSKNVVKFLVREAEYGFYAALSGFLAPDQLLLESIRTFSVDRRDRNSGILAVQAVQVGGCIFEETVVEFHYVGKAPPVFLKAALVAFREILCDFPRHEVPVRASPAVDALLDISYQEILEALGVAVGNQGLEVLPLHAGGILELVQEEMLEAYAQFLVDERGVGSIDYVLENDVGVVQAEDVLLLHKVPELAGQVGSYAQVVDLPK